MKVQSLRARMIGATLPILMIWGCSARTPAPISPAVPTPPTTALPTAPTATMTLTLTDNECTFDGPATIPHGVLTVNLKMDEQTPTQSGYVLVTLREGKSIEDLRAISSAVRAPDWVNSVDLMNKSANGEYAHTYDYTKVATSPPLYLVCFNSDPSSGAWTIRAAFGPFELK